MIGIVLLRHIAEQVQSMKKGRVVQAVGFSPMYSLESFYKPTQNIGLAVTIHVVL